MRDFNFYVGGIEDELIEKLRSALGVPSGGYVKRVESYGGELDADTIREYLEEYLPNLPCLLVCYGYGKDVQMPATGSERGKPRVIQHDATFLVFCCSGDARGERARRRGAGSAVGVYKMLSDVRDKLSGVELFKADGAEQVLLTLDPLLPSGVEFTMRLPEVTAYAQRFDTYFKWLEPDRREEGRAVESVSLDVNSTGSNTAGANMPGVLVEP